MHIIVTHTNADFDAVASLLGAWYLYPEALPVLPPTLNRNVRDFITLYESELPFLRQHDLGRSPIDQVTLVDTQYLYKIKNLKPEARLHIIDHHELHQSLPPETIVTLTDTGATITLLVEQIRTLAKRPSSIEATLMVMGIYEDTGSLTYSSTTSRDLQAAAWLLSKGARLDIVRDYLNYAMNEEQKTLYDRLVGHLETHTIQGHVVMIGSTRVHRYVEEISGLASRIRDLYQPEALFILVEMTDHVQMVARSVTEAINVGHMAEFFEGGGHPRAAAALIKDKKLEAVKQELLRLLHLEIQPALTVAKIMSRGVRTLAPTDTVQYTAEMMDRYGHEGFPVIEAKTQKIVGIISRREVDKARRHKLDGAAISYFMKKGELFVTPADSIDTVQQMMTEQQIGQVPVVSETDGSVIGIVTRTDLINLWQLTSAEKSSRPNLASQLEATFSAELFTFLREAGELAGDNGDTLYIVGGSVRDLLLTMLTANGPAKNIKTSPRFDLDLVVEGDAIALAHRLQERHGGRVHSHRRFGTAKWIPDQPIPFDVVQAEAKGGHLTSLDFVTARTEFYRHPSALPEVEQSSIRQDLHRRDFTINTLALRLSPDNFGELLDFYSGQSDLEAGLIRVLHNLSFVEDPTRMLRAARLMARLDFKLEARTAELLENALDLLYRVSGERITHELELVFRERHLTKALRQLDELGILAAIHPGLSVDDMLIDRFIKLNSGLEDTPWGKAKPGPVHYLGLMTFWLARDELEQLMERLNLRVAQRNILKQAYTIHRQASQIAGAQQASHLYHLLEATSDEARLIAWLGLDNDPARQQLVRFQAELRDVTPLIDGHYLKREFHLPPGPIYRTIIDALRDARLDGLVISLDDERAMVERLLAQQGDEGQ